MHEHRARSVSPGSRWSLGAVFWVLVLTGVGALLLVRGLGYALPIWQALARYWPALFAVWALIRVMESRFGSGQRSRFEMREAALLTFVVVLGAVFTATAHLSSSLDFLGITLGAESDLFDILGENHEFVSQLGADAAPEAHVTLQNFSGSVDVVVGEGSRINVGVRKTVRASSREEAESLASQMRFTLSERDGGYVLVSNRAQLDPSLRRRFKSSLYLEVPRAASLTIYNRYGAVRLDGLSGDQCVENAFGGVTVRDTTGAIEITNRHGDIRLSFDTPPSNSLSLISSDADINLELPATSNFSIDLQARSGSFDTDFESLEISGSDLDLRVSGQQGVGGPHITIVSEGGAVRLLNGR